VLCALRTALPLWALRLDSELQFVGDAGTTEPQGRSERTGFAVANYRRPQRSLTIDGDVSFARAALLDGAPSAARVPGAAESVMASGASVLHARQPRAGYSVLLRVTAGGRAGGWGGRCALPSDGAAAGAGECEGAVIQGLSTAQAQVPACRLPALP
jgi:hypothetical protein